MKIQSKILKRNKMAILGIALMTLACSLPLMVSGIHEGDDAFFHLFRIEAIAKELEDLNFPVRMQSLWNNGYGYPTSIYYCDVLLYIPALLRIAGVPMMAAYKTFLCLVNFGTALFSFLSFKRIFKEERIALTVAFVYVTATYRFTDLYIRAAVGEYVAIMFLPLVALAMYRIYVDDGDRRKNACLLAFGMTGILTAHMLTLEMCVVVLVIVCVFLWRKTFCKRVLKTYCAAVLWTLLLNAWFLVPFLDYYKNELVVLNQSISLSVGMIQKKGASIADLFSCFYNFSYERILSPGIVLMAVFLLALVMVWKLPNKKIRLFTILSGLMLFLATNLFPWDFLAKTSTLGNLMAQIQFPWRYLVFADLFLALLLGGLLSSVKSGNGVKEKSQRWRFVAGRNLKSVCMRGIALVCVLYSMMFFAQYSKDAGLVSFMEIVLPTDDSESVYIRVVEGDALNMQDLYLNSDELYLRISVDENGEIEKAENADLDTDVLKSDTVIKCESVGQNSGLERTVRVNTDAKEGWIEFPVFNYKGYHVTDEEGNEYEISDGTNFRVRVTVPADFDGELTLCFCEPWYWRLSEGISLGAILLYVMAVCGRSVRQFTRQNGRSDE